MAKDRRVRWTRDAKLKRLAKVQLFSNCTKTDLGRIASLADEIEVPAGQVLARKGEAGHQAFVILGGNATVEISGGDKVRLGPGDYFGEMALLDAGGKRSATVTARTDMDLLVLNSRQFLALIDQVPAVRRRILAALADRLRVAERGHAAH